MKRQATILPLALGVSILLAALLMGSSLRDGTGQRDCGAAPDFAGWKQATTHATVLSERYEDKRREVADHLVSCGSLRGASSAEVLRRLGRPPDAKVPPTQGDSWVYYLGPDGLGIDDENLYVEFDARRHAARFTVSQS